MAQIARETEYAANLQRARRRAAEQPRSQKTDAEALKQISLIEAFFFMAFMGIAFDLPQALLAATLLGSLLNIIWVPIGYLIAYLWLKLKGRSLMGGKSGNKLLYSFGITSGAELISGGLLPGLSGFILSVVLTERTEKVMKKAGIPTVGSVVKKTG